MDSVETKTKIKRVLAAEPELTYVGFRARGNHGAPKGIDAESTPAKFADERETLLSDDAVREVEDCIAYLSLVRPTKTARGRGAPSSYGMKHRVEAWTRSKGAPRYIANGSFIVACLITGHPIHRDELSSPNCRIGVFSRDVTSLQTKRGPGE